MLVAAVEVDLAAKDERALVARTTEAWLLTLRENLADVEQDTEGAFGARRELATLLVEGITVSRGEDGRPRVEITYRFGPPEPGPGQAARESALDVEDSELPSTKCLDRSRFPRPSASSCSAWGTFCHTPEAVHQ
ncbi:MAG: hypothetical protein AVDCRST_MAG03-798 [uncultured Rubrobacteraceae bacterium]|uniref:Uncharacterized protein n=1 Tax=uncultured Rubrobacteraceae bacterium TaxID=349277 RepID=A0A6J4NPC9_9ACTN|nr:MAG: hypothetical protein AVDCRST_MAG03-798 [uncultured Rubrobacteraceae bacterium]